MLENKKGEVYDKSKLVDKLNTPLYKKKLRPKSISNLIDSSIDRMKK